MKITFICVGGVKKACIKESVQEYFKRIGRYSPVEVREVREEPSTKMSRDEALRKEGEKILDKIRPGDLVITLHEGGKAYGSKEFSALLEGFLSVGRKSICFIVGGPWGLHKSVMEASSMAVSLSRMTLPHDLARLILFEQVYRAFTIIKGEPYSH